LVANLPSRGRIERKLIRLLGNFDANLADDYLQAIQQFHKSVEGTIDPQCFEWLWFGPNEPFAFIASFDEPLFLLLSHPISRFLKARKYPVLSNECKLCFDLALVPAYLVSFNTYTVIRFWSEGARRFFSPTSAPLSDEQEFWAFYPKRGGAQLSSMNFLLKKNADARFAPDSIRVFMHDFFTYFFWSFPHRGFSSCAHFIHDDRNIRTLLKVSKTIYSIRGIYDDSLAIGRKEMKIKRAIVSGLMLENGKPKVTTRRPILTTDILSDLSELKDRRFFINGVLSEFRRRGRTRFNTLTVVAEWGVNQVELYMALIGMVVWDMFKKGKDLSYVGSVEEIRSQVYNIFQFLTKYVRLDRSFADTIEEPFQYALRTLFPIVASDGKDVFFCHPYLFSAFEKYGITSTATSKANLLSVLKILDNAQSKTERELYSSVETAKLGKGGIPKWLLIKALKDSINGILFSRILHSNFVDRQGVDLGEEEHGTREEYEKRSEDALNLCPECLGKRTITEYIPRDTGTHVKIRPVTRKCWVCKGKGFLDTKVDD